MAITVTSSARNELLRLLGRSLGDLSSAPAHVRLGIAPGGCAGQTYQLDLHKPEREGDRCLPLGAVTLLIDEQTWPLLENLTLDYSEDLMGGSFRFDNPALTQSCSCGQSFQPLSP